MIAVWVWGSLKRVVRRQDSRFSVFVRYESRWVAASKVFSFWEPGFKWDSSQNKSSIAKKSGRFSFIGAWDASFRWWSLESIFLDRLRSRVRSFENDVTRALVGRRCYSEGRVDSGLRV